MPIISVFSGIVIRMYYLDHEPAHFHVEYRGRSAIFHLGGRVMWGDLESRKVRRLIEKWARVHRFELEANWQRGQAGRPLARIEPLDRGEL